MSQKTAQNLIKAAWVYLCLTVVCILAACGSNDLKGSYKSQGLAAQTFTFDGDVVTMSAFFRNG